MEAGVSDVRFSEVKEGQFIQEGRGMKDTFLYYVFRKKEDHVECRYIFWGKVKTTYLRKAEFRGKRFNPATKGPYLNSHIKKIVTAELLYEENGNN